MRRGRKPIGGYTPAWCLSIENERKGMKLNRRQFLVLSACAAGGCVSPGEGGGVAAGKAETVNAGPAGLFATDGVYSNFSARGFFIVRHGGRLFALSAICTHRKCALAAEPDGSLYCRCHGSTFDRGGHVTKGPARRDLPVLSAYTNEQGQFVVSVPTEY